jgi:hypothetical protein
LNVCDCKHLTTIHPQLSRPVSCLNALQFGLREKFLGRFTFRSGLPKTPHSTYVTPEHRFYRLLVESFYPESERNQITRVIDVGCRNGSYLPELKRLFPQASVLGIELDAYRRYWNLYRRGDYARAYALSCGAEVVFGDFLKLSLDDLTLPTEGKVLITQFFPFVSENPCLKWGLPAFYSNFGNQIDQIKKIKSFAAKSLQIEVLTAHQGEWEAERIRMIPVIQPRFQEKVFEPEHFKNFWPSPYPVHSFRIFI